MISTLWGFIYLIVFAFGFPWTCVVQALAAITTGIVRCFLDRLMPFVRSCLHSRAPLILRGIFQS